MTPGPRRFGAAEILPLLEPGATLHGSLDRLAVTRAAPVSSASADAISWIRDGHPRAQELLDATCAGLVVCSRGLDAVAAVARGVCVAGVDRPKVAFSRIAAALLDRPAPEPGIHPSAVVHPEAAIGAGVHVGPLAVIGRAVVGDGCVIDARCTIHDGVRIGCRVRIGSGTVIGGQGFSYDWDGHGVPVPFPHLGGVVIEDDVIVHTNATIDRGSLQDTIVRRGAAIDSFVYVSHNCTVGEGTVIAGHTALGGSVTVGARCWLGIGLVLRDGIAVGDGAFIGMGSVVTRDVAAGERVMGSPALPVAEQKARLAALRRLAAG